MRDVISRRQKKIEIRRNHKCQRVDMLQTHRNTAYKRCSERSRKHSSPLSSFAFKVSRFLEQNYSRTSSSLNLRSHGPLVEQSRRRHWSQQWNRQSRRRIARSSRLESRRDRSSRRQNEGIYKMTESLIVK